MVPLSEAMMPTLSARIKEVWLDTAVPSSLDSMREYQKALAQVHEFAEVLRALKWPGVDSFNDWVSNVPRIWLAKKREDALDWVRNSLSLGTCCRASSTVFRAFVGFLHRALIQPSRYWDASICPAY